MVIIIDFFFYRLGDTGIIKNYNLDSTGITF
jgi:hypothetical protein